LAAAQAQGLRDVTVFIGDSITEGLLSPSSFGLQSQLGWFWGHGRSLLNRFENDGIKPVVLAVSGQQLQHQIARYIETKEVLATLKPRMFVIMLGTNNVNQFGLVDALADGLVNFGDVIHRDFPCTSVILQAIIPNAIVPSVSNAGKSTQQLFGINARVEAKVKVINSLSSAECKGSLGFQSAFDNFFLDGQPDVTFSNINNVPNQSWPTTQGLFADGIHPNEAGYDAWYEATGLRATLRERYKCVGESSFVK
jgi:lysophospholipase L1-like esterase